MSEQALALHQEDAHPPANTGGALTPMEMIGRALDSGATTETMEKLMALQERWEANQGRKAFDKAIAEAKAELPVIIKNREVDFTSSKGRTHYRHEDLAGIARQIDPILSRHGLSYRFRSHTEAGQVTVTCIVAHRGGYSEETTLSAGVDQSGNKNHIQAIGSATTYLQRYTLKVALGLSASEDDDGRRAEPVSQITEDQAKEIKRLLHEGKASAAEFCDRFNIETVDDLPAEFFATATKKLQLRIDRMAADKEAAQ